MALNKMRQMLETNEFAIGTMVQIPSETVVELLGYVGFDYLIIDIEHTSFDVERVESLVRAAQSVDTPSFVRLWGVDRALIARTLDTGVEGLMFPLVSTRQEAEEAVRFSRLVPAGGVRGMCPETRSGRYWTMPWDEYDRRADETVITVMIETKEGLENVDEILSVPGVDVVVVGPGDLAYSLGVPFDSPVLEEANDKVVKAAEKAGVRVMQCAYNVKMVGERLQKHQGHGLFWYRSDNMIISDAFSDITKQCEELGYRRGLTVAAS